MYLEKAIVEAARLNFGTGFTLNQTDGKAEMLLNAVPVSVFIAEI